MLTGPCPRSPRHRSISGQSFTREVFEPELAELFTGTAERLTEDLCQGPGMAASRWIGLHESAVPCIACRNRVARTMDAVSTHTLAALVESTACVHVDVRQGLDR